jgi:hypothetical protein
MEPNNQLVTLRCAHCNQKSIADRADLSRRLREIGLLKRETDPAWLFLVALLDEAAVKLVCDDCGRPGQIPSVLDVNDDDWGEGRQCAGCSQRIPPERLEVFPEAEFCAACQARDERGESPGEEIEYCPRCGDIMQVARTRGAGIARYELRCTTCKR